MRALLFPCLSFNVLNIYHRAACISYILEKEGNKWSLRLSHQHKEAPTALQCAAPQGVVNAAQVVAAAWRNGVLWRAAASGDEWQ